MTAPEQWHRACTYTNGCVQVMRADPDMIVLSDSGTPLQRAYIPVQAFAQFVEDVKAGRFDAYASADCEDLCVERCAGPCGVGDLAEVGRG